MPTSESPQPWKQWDHEHSWHPFTQMREWMAEDPLFIERGDGNYLIASDGRRYFDATSSLWCNLHGHGRPEIVAAIAGQAAQLAHSTMLGLSNLPATELAKRLIDIAPKGLTRVFYSDSGATAVEVALKMAFAYWQLRGEPGRDVFVSLNEGYHGDTIGSLSVGYMELFDRPYRQLLFPCVKLNPPHYFRYYRRQSMEEAVSSALAEAEITLTRDRRRIAALIVEPLMQAAAVMWNHPVDYLAGLARLCRQNNILLIADEVAVGFGRTGKMFACDHAGITPDLMCLAKGISGGTLPLAATLTTEEVFHAFLGDFAERKTFFHGHTYTGNPIGCAAALASLDIFEKDNVLQELPFKIHALEEALHPLRNLPHVADIRQWGVMVGIEIAEDAKARRSFPSGLRLGKRVIMAARRRGVILRPLGDVVILNPPLSTTIAEMQHIAAVSAEAISEACAEVIKG
ncbi:MAG: adenosylmethionine--8-amino-7-oxononanoate transaminase [Acidobacteria bacterium]|nr:adenosylmethionine--8-amino-7-oxononanoate transaminase [Acidobacteriota bacterium]